MPNARASLRPFLAPSGLGIPSVEPSIDCAERRTEPRFTPTDLRHRVVARHKYGESVTLVDLSVGGVQFETPRLIRPDANVVLEIIDSRTREISQVISRVLRANVSALSGGIRYRAACAFRRPLSHSTLIVPPTAPARQGGPDYLKLELELKTIVEDYLKRPRGAGAAGRRPPSSLLDALVHLRSAAERRRDPTDRHLGGLLAAMIPALQQREPTDAILRKLHDRLAEQLPLLAIRTNNVGGAFAPDCESITVNVHVDANPLPMAITAEFPPGFGLDASQFRLLKLGAYLVGLIERWNTHALTGAPAAPMPRDSERATHPPAAAETDEWSDGLPFGWHRVVLRYMDEQLLHGYSNDFHPDRACFQFSPRVGCPASEKMLVPFARLKAVFFVKDLHGDRNHVDVQTFDHAPRGRKVQVTFRDGELMTGSTLNYKPNGQGFFVLPANTGGNNVRAYVVTTAIRHIRFV
jgi:hypothetical protein